MKNYYLLLVFAICYGNPIVLCVENIKEGDTKVVLSQSKKAVDDISFSETGKASTLAQSSKPSPVKLIFDTDIDPDTHYV